MDIEWALCDGRVHILQARPITGLPDVFVPKPEEWELPSPDGRYMRASIIDMMPDPLSPLFATMGVPIYNESILQMMVDITGSRKENLPGDVIQTIQDYAYMRVNFSAREWWAMVVKMGPKLINLIRSGPDHFRHVALPEYERQVEVLQREPVDQLSLRELWADAHALTSAAMDHLSILQVDTLGAAAGSEGLFTALYKRWFQAENDPPARAFVMGYDSTPVRAEKSLYDLAQWARERPDLRAYLLGSAASEISASIEAHNAPEGVQSPVWEGWLDRLQAHIEQYGHLLYDLDFAKPVPSEDPTPQLETMKMYLQGEGADPHARQRRLEESRSQATEKLLERARGLRGWAVQKALGWAQSVGEVREDSIASIGLAYPRLRENLKEIGRRMADAKAIRQPVDIFWLKAEEIESRFPLIQAQETLQPMTEAIEKRRKRREAEARIMPPTQLPPSKTYMGIPIEVFVPGEGGAEAGRLKGVGASAGLVTGTACVLRGPEDFDRMRPGGILVAKLTTPAWTPLFAMAAGVVTDIGGPLSHGSIVAREYGIPAVLGTGAATRVIETGQQITVDGDAGYVTLST
jgi:pyruvate,water dikinase